MYAIIDIETTGGRPGRDRITEIAIVIHDGNTVTHQFSTLINPECLIPYYITKLTGITNEMVTQAPKFHEIAKKLIELTENCVFVAHNVNFDYHFVKASYKSLGYDYNRKTLCTVKLSRKTFVGLPSYSLGKLCKSLNIEIKDRHRALGDAEATAIVFDKIIKANPLLLSKENLKAEIKRTAIPPELNEEIINALPEYTTGVYYFHDKTGEVIYVGKSLDIKKRIQQHFAVATKGNRRSLLLKAEVANITYENTGSELVALLLESDEIKHLKPRYNLAQKKVKAIPYYGIFHKKDTQGFINFYTHRLTENAEPLYTIDGISEAKKVLYTLIDKNKLCLAKCDLHKTSGACFNYQIQKCAGACCGKENAKQYNSRATKIIDKLTFKNESFYWVDKGRNENEKAIVCIENGIYKGYGYVNVELQNTTYEWRDHIQPCYHNKDIRLILKKFASQKLPKMSFSPAQLQMF